MIIVSACLAGVKCRYDGGDKARTDLVKLVQSGQAIAVCPEELGGLTTPRPASEQCGDKVLSITGEDVTAAFQRGAEKALEIVIEKSGGKSFIDKAILKSCSPMCGKGTIYDGSFSGKKIAGDGIFCQLLNEHNITTEERD